MQKDTQDDSYMSEIDFCSQFKNMSFSTAKRFHKKVKTMRDYHDISTELTTDDIFGDVRLYPKTALQTCWEMILDELKGKLEPRV